MITYIITIESNDEDAEAVAADATSFAARSLAREFPTQLPVASLQETMMVDLMEIRDWLGINGDEPAYLLIEMEYGVVEGVEPETSDCTVLHTHLGSFGLPPDLLVTVTGYYEGE